MLAWAFTCGALFLVLTTMVTRRWEPLLDLDQAVADRFFAFTSAHDGVRRGAEEVATLTEPAHLVWLGYAAGLVLLLTRQVRAAIVVALVPLLAAQAYPHLKDRVERARPHWAHPLDVVGGYSFPSGHATVAAATAGAAIALAALLMRPGPARRTAMGLAAVAALLVGLDRILLGVHYASDVAAGLLLGTTVTLFTFAIVDPQPRVRTFRAKSATTSPSSATVTISR